jgi:serine phosphatase RsbU (regulator of sigma subunit)
VTDVPVGGGDVELASTATAGGSEHGLLARLVDLAKVVADMAGAVDLRTVAEIVTASAATVLDADAASLCVTDASGLLRLIAFRDAAGTAMPRWDRFGLDAPIPAAEAVRTRAPVTASGPEEIRRRWPGTFKAVGPPRSLVALPLLVGDRCIGAVGLSFRLVQPFEGMDGQFLGVLADSCAQAIERITATASATEAAAKLSFLADASEALAASLDYEVTLRRVAQLAVPELADWCSIDLLEDGKFRRVAISHVDPSKVQLAWRLYELYPPDVEASVGAPAVARTGVSELVEQVDTELLDSLDLGDELRQVVRDLKLTSALTVALRARGRTLGVLSLVYAESGRHYGADDVRFAEDLARRAAVAIDNSQLHTETLQVALSLQRAVLPDTLTSSRTWQLAVHYRPAGRTDVGGDFYDAVSLGDHSLVAVVGDVMGRGVAAAAAMAQVRAALRAYLADDPDPGRVFTRLDRMFARLELPQLVTLLYVVFDPAAGQAQLISAGHLPPLVINADGGVQRLQLDVSPPLGAGSHDRHPTVVTFEPTDTMLAYTDGLVERRGEDIDEGLSRLASAAPALSGSLSDALLAGLADQLRQAGHDDDVTLLAIRAQPGTT